MTQSLQKQGVELLEAGRFDEAKDCFLRALRTNADKANVMNLLGITTARQGNYPEALELMNKALAINGDVATIHHNIGPIYRALGDFAKAEQHYRKALQLKPDYAEAYFNLAAVKKFAAQDDALTDIETLLARAGTSDEDRCFLHFAAGKIYDDIGEYDGAFAHYLQANQLRGVSYLADEQAQIVERIIAKFDRTAFANFVTSGNDSRVPIFVVGMPRSGTTLIEQILASHPDVFGAGELPDITSIAHTIPDHVPDPLPYPDYIDRVPHGVIAGFAEAYLRRVGTLGEGSPRIVDKMPQNFLFLGLIALMFPDAKIIHCRRDPLDTCLSCFFQRFRVGQEYSYDLEHLGKYYRKYLELMEHWAATLPIPMFDACYEELVTEPQRVSRQMLEHCELDWDDACLRPHLTKRPVTTASNLQVRRPVTASSVERWRHYEDHLSPLIAAMGLH